MTSLIELELRLLNRSEKTFTVLGIICSMVLSTCSPSGKERKMKTKTIGMEEKEDKNLSETDCF